MGCEPTREEIIATRATRFADYRTYVRDMYRDINLESNIVDLGYPKDVNLDDFEALTGVPAYGLFRIEPLIGQLFDQHDSLAGLEKAFVERMGGAAADRRIICFKSV